MNNFARACMLSNEEWIDSFPVEIQAYEFSKHHNKQMNKLFSKMSNNQYHKYTKNTTRALIITAGSESTVVYDYPS